VTHLSFVPNFSVGEFVKEVEEWRGVFGELNLL